MKKYIIEDWAGNHLFKNKEFDSYEDGFEFLREKFDETDLDDVFVIPKK